MTSTRRPRLALVVPNLAGNGGVQAVGRFIRTAAVGSGAFDLQLVSLSESSRDPMSLRLSSPATWFTRPSVMHGVSERFSYSHVGAVAGELEFQRYRARGPLTALLAGCDVVQVVCGSPAWATSVMDLGVPVSMHVATLAREERRRRDAYPAGPAGWWRKAMTSLTAAMDDQALRGVSAVQVMNPWMFEHVTAVNKGRDVDVQYLPPGIDAESFRPRAVARPPVPKYVLCVGRLSDPRKNIELLFEAFARLRLRVSDDTRLVLVGSSPTSAAWQRAESLGLRDRIDFHEQTDPSALLRLYQDASVFALPSDEEGFGMVLLEAMACGVPVVSTRSGGPDGIITDGNDGYLVARDDVEALSSRLAELLEDAARAEAMGARARQTIERRFDDRVAGPPFVNLWKRLVRA